MEEINLKRLLEVTLSLKWVIIGILILMMALGGAYSFFYVVPKYDSSIKLVLAQVEQENTTEEKTSDAITSTDIIMNNQLVLTYSEIIKSKNIMKSVIEKLQLNIDEEALSKKIDVRSVKDTQVLKITVVDENPKVAKNIATEVAEVFIEQIKEIYNISNINIIDQAEISEEPYNVNHIKDIMIFEVLGLFLSSIIVGFFYLVDTTIKDENEIERKLGLPSLGSLPLYKEKVNGEVREILSFEDSKSPITECFRTLRTNLLFAKNNSNLKNILVISSFSSEGKSYVTANLAMSFAKANKKVIIIDADMRKGRQHKIFKLNNFRGLSNCLINIPKFDYSTIDEISKYVNTTKYPNIHLITSGTRPSNPLELISSNKMSDLINMLDKIYDYVIIDGTPINIVSDSVALSKYIDTTVLICEYKKTKLESLNKVKKLIENVDGTITGIILNKCPITERDYTEKYYYVEDYLEDDEKKIKNEEDEKRNIKSFRDLIEEVDFESLNEYEDIEKQEDTINIIPAKETGISNVNSESNFVEYKLENISMEISSMKDLMIRMAMETNKKDYEKEIKDLKKEIKTLKTKMK